MFNVKLTSICTFGATVNATFSCWSFLIVRFITSLQALRLIDHVFLSLKYSNCSYSIFELIFFQFALKIWLIELIKGYITYFNCLNQTFMNKCWFSFHACGPHMAFGLTKKKSIIGFILFVLHYGNGIFIILSWIWLS